MEAALVAMAAHTLIVSPLHISSNPHHPPPLLRSSSSSSSFLHGPFLKLPRQSLTFSLSAKPLTIVSAAKKAVAVLKGTSSVEGVVTLTQEDNGLSSLLYPPFIVGFFIYNSLSGCWELRMILMHGSLRRFLFPWCLRKMENSAKAMSYSRIWQFKPNFWTCISKDKCVFLGSLFLLFCTLTIIFSYNEWNNNIRFGWGEFWYLLDMEVIQIFRLRSSRVLYVPKL